MRPGRYNKQFLHDQEEENSPDSPSSGDEARTAPSPSPSPKKRRKGMEKKRVISVPIKVGDDDDDKQQRDWVWGSSSSAAAAAYPPADSWAWRKYGQKPIKGSPYPRGYYRCSSSKGCPARKQVERSRLDPTMLLISYSSDHNHPLPAPKHLLLNHQQESTKSDPEDSPSASASASASASTGEFVAAEIRDDSLINDPDFHWLTEAASAISYPRRPIYSGGDCAAVATVSAFSMGEEDESLFGDLGELPECALVFRLGNPVKQEETSRQCSMAAVPCVGQAV